jgi:hypothetical protein
MNNCLRFIPPMTQGSRRRNVLQQNCAIVDARIINRSGGEALTFKKRDLKQKASP